MSSMRRHIGPGASLAGGVILGVVFALVVSRLAFPSTGTVSTLAAQVPASMLVYTTGTVPLLASPAGSPIATLTGLTPVTVLATQGTFMQVRLDLYRSPASPTILYQDVPKLERAGVLASPSAARAMGTVTIAGSSWQRVRLVGWIPQGATSGNLNSLWSQASSLYSNSCGTCHSAHDASEFTARQWVSQFRAMVPRTSLTPGQADLVLKWLQAHAGGR